MSQRILLVEDDEAVVFVLTEALTDSGYDVSAVGSAHAALTAIPSIAPDLIMLDLGLPDDDGLVLLPSLRALTQAGIIVVSARQTQADRIVSLKLGADAFVAKPFDLPDLEARIEAVLRRMPAPPPADEIRAGDILITLSRARVQVGSRLVDMTPIQFRMLTILAAHVDETVTRATMLEKIWGYNDRAGEHNVAIHIARLRKKLRQAGSYMLIGTMRNKGFVLANWKGDS